MHMATAKKKTTKPKKKAKKKPAAAGVSEKRFQQLVDLVDTQQNTLEGFEKRLNALANDIKAARHLIDAAGGDIGTSSEPNEEEIEQFRAKVRKMMREDLDEILRENPLLKSRL